MKKSKIIFGITLFMISYSLLSQVTYAQETVAMSVGNSQSNTVSKIPKIANAVTATIPVGSSPNSVAVNPDTNTVYVVNVDSMAVSVISGIGTVSGTVYSEQNCNNVQDNGEPGIPGVLVTLYSYTTQQSVGTVTTNSSGQYTFANVPIGGIAILETIPPGTTVTQPATSPPGVYYSTISSGQTAIFNFGNHVSGATTCTVMGTVYDDLNGNGVQDLLDPSVAGITISLFSNATGQIVDTTTTDTDGHYTFTNVPPGEVTVIESTPVGIVTTQPATGSGVYHSTITLGKTLTLNFGNHAITPGIVSGTIYNDANDNSVQDIGESGITGITLLLYYYPSPFQSPVIVGNTTTDLNGHYTFTNILPGGIAVQELIPPNSSVTNTGPTFNNAYYSNVSAGQTVTLNFGNKITEKGTLTGIVYFDGNGNSVQDNGETGSEGVMIMVYSYAIGLPTLVGNTTTDSNGHYTVTNVPLGGIAVLETIPPGTTNTQPDGTSPGAYYSIDSDQTDTFNFGNKASSNATGIVTGTIYNDVNGNGIQDNGESGMAGVTVLIYSYITGNMVGQTVTDSFGHYTLSNIPSGGIAVMESIPAGKTNTQPGGSTPGVYYSNLAPEGTATFNFGNH